MGREEAIKTMLGSATGSEREAAAYHLGLMEDEDGEHYSSNNWEDCGGCRHNNPYYEAARRQQTGG